MDTAALVERAKGLTKKDRVTRIEEIRLMAMAALHGVEGAFPAWHYYAELKYLRRNPPSPLFLEAVIATSVAGRLRPSNTVRALSVLKKRRIEADERALFDAFEAFLGDRIPTNHSYESKTFQNREHAAIWGAVGDHIAALEGMGYRCFLNSGTLLGVVRDGKFIDHDDDVDLALILNATTEAEAVEEWMALWQRLVDLGLAGAGGLDTPGIYKLKAQDGCEIDLFPCWISEGDVYIYPHTYADLTVDDVLPLRACDVSGCPLPADPEKMLAVNYGDGWREPDPYYKFPWTRAVSRFKNFLRAVS